MKSECPGLCVMQRCNPRGFGESMDLIRSCWRTRDEWSSDRGSGLSDRRLSRRRQAVKDRWYTVVAWCTSYGKRVRKIGCNLAQPSGGVYKKEQARPIKMIHLNFWRSSRKVDNSEYWIFVKLSKKKCSRPCGWGAFGWGLVLQGYEPLFVLARRQHAVILFLNLMIGGFLGMHLVMKGFPSSFNRT